MTRYLEFNDWELILLADDGSELYRDIAAASASTGELIFGTPAWAAARRDPQRFNARYLSSLSADPVTGDLGPARNHADLIFHHLKALPVGDDPVVIGIPGCVSNEQLGVLLGICAEAGLTVAGFVDTALVYLLTLQAETVELPNDPVLIDLEMNRLLTTRLSLQGPGPAVLGTTPSNGLGLLGIIEGWMNVLADEFVGKTRFDPMHAAETEQQMLNQVFQWCTDRRIKSRMTIDHAGTSREIEVSEGALIEKLALRLETLELDAPLVLLTPRAARIPGFLDILAGKNIRAVEISELSTFDAYRLLSQDLGPDAVRRISQFEGSLGATAQEPLTATGTATHLLHTNVAMALNASQFQAFIDAASRSTCHPDVMVNHDQGSGIPIHPGDRVVFMDIAYTAIRVE